MHMTCITEKISHIACLKEMKIFELQSVMHCARKTQKQLLLLSALGKPICLDFGGSYFMSHRKAFMNINTKQSITIQI